MICTFSILTCVRNARDVVQNCLKSVSGQLTPSEHIIIDGGSTDGTLEILEQYSSDTLKYISEPDKGPFDAMNKAIKMARGDVIGILNADDFYADNHVLEAVAEVFEDPEVDSCYGDLDYVERENTVKVVRRWVSGPYDQKNWYRGWMPPHPTFFVRRSIYENLGLYRLDMGTSADYELMLRCVLKHGITTCYIPRVLVKMRRGGMSNVTLKNRVRANLMDRRAWRVNSLKPKPWTMWMKPLGKVGQWRY